ncbi:MAG: response regulator [Candidatus Eisenbacteria bacterium]|nr:response regulator [Candidatus Eisenbacteria bacterium]
MAKQDPIVFVVDDDPTIRRSLKWLVESVGLKVEGYASGQEFLAAYDPSTPGCLVLDLRMPGLSGLDIQERLAEKEATLPIIMITAHGEVETAVQSMRAGAFDFINKPFSKQLLLDRIQQALSHDAEERRLQAERVVLQERLASLSGREREVMDLVVAGRSNREAAEALGISAKTVEFHRARLMEKLAVDSLADLVRLAVRMECHQERESKPGPQ